MLTITMTSLWLPYPGFLTAREIEFPVQFNGGFGVVSTERGRRDLGVAAGAILQRLAFEAAMALRGFLGIGQHLQFPLQLEIGLPLLAQLHVFQVKHHGQQFQLCGLQNENQKPYVSSGYTYSTPFCYKSKYREYVFYY